MLAKIKFNIIVKPVVKAVRKNVFLMIKNFEDLS